MKITLIKPKSTDFTSLDIFRENLLKIDGVELSDNPGAITYWLSIGNYLLAKERGQAGRKNIVLFNPSGNWKEAESSADYMVYVSKRYFHQSPNKNKHFISVGIDLDLFKPDIKIGMIAIYRPIKGYRILKDIVFDKDITDCFSFHFAGPRWDMFIKSVGARAPQPKLYGEIPMKDIPRFYNSMDYILIATDPNNGEGGPFPVMEALACGKRVITTDVGFVREFDTLIFKDVKDLKEILLSIKEGINLTFREPLQRFSWDKYREKHRKLFKEVYEA